jgi:MoxR-like ATPase
MIDRQRAASAAAVLVGICDNVETVIVGKREQVELVVCALVAGGHVLLEDMPGTGKTSLVSAMAKSIQCDFKRIQFTPDVMPSDVTGFSIFNQRTRDFEFRAGSVMSNLVLADEINRASAKTQSALLEAMEERQVTVDGETHQLEEPFMVLATQNPIEQYGTYPLPEAQLDRFLIKLSLGYPQLDEEVRVVLKVRAAQAAIGPVATGADVLEVRAAAQEVGISAAVARYAVQIAAATRTMKECAHGSSPRGSMALVNLGRAHALLRGRSYVSPDDIKYLAPYVLAHRIGLTHEARIAGRNPMQVINSVLDSVATPSLDEAEALELG